MRSVQLVFVAGFTALLSLAGCSKDEKDELKGTILVKGLFDLTGATADVGVQGAYGVIDAIQETQEPGFRIKGYQIKMDEGTDWVDFRYDTPMAVSKVAEWSSQPEWGDVAAVFGWSWGASIALAPTMTADKKAYISPGAYVGDLASPVPIATKTIALPNGGTHPVSSPGYPYNFFAATDYSTQIRIALKFVSEQGGTKKIGFVHCDSAFCTLPIWVGKNYSIELGLSTGGGDALEDDLRVQFVEDQSVTDAAVTAYFAKPGNADINWLWMGNTNASTIRLMKALASTGHGDVKVIGVNWAADETVATTCGASCQGKLYVVTPFANYGNTEFGDAMTDVMRAHDKARQKKGEALTLYADIRYIQGYCSFMLLRRGIEALSDANQAITGENLRNAFNHFHNLPMGGLAPPISYSDADHRPMNRARIYLVRENRLDYQNEFFVDMKEEWKGY